MAFKITIKYNGLAKDVERIVASVCRVFSPYPSYIDLPVYEEGYKVGVEEASKKYGKSVYATNVAGIGEVGLVPPYTSEMVPVPFPAGMHYFTFAAQAKEGTVTFTVESWKDAMYYKEIAKVLAPQGFEVTVEEVTDQKSE